MPKTTSIGGRQYYEIAPHLENSGNSPAIKIAMGSTRVRVEQPENGIMIPEIDFSNDLVTGPKAVWPTKSCLIEEISGMHIASYKPYALIMAAQYEDIFGICHVTVQCGIIRWDQTGSFAPMTRDRSCADDSCPTKCNEDFFRRFRSSKSRRLHLIINSQATPMQNDQTKLVIEERAVSSAG